MKRTVSAFAAAALLLAACTTVPDSSSPQVVQQVGVQDPNGIINGPPPGAQPRAIVYGFLNASGAADPNDPNLASARQYLTPGERAGWGDSTATIVDHTQVRNFAVAKHVPTGQTGTITVIGHQVVGTIDETGAYKPFLSGNGDGLGGSNYSQTFGLEKVNGEWRINSVRPAAGLLVTSAQFESFHQYRVYFYDSNEQDLVPVARYTQLSNPTDLVPWLVQELAAQPPAGLGTELPQNGANSVKVSNITDPSDPTKPIRIEVPGADSLGRNSLGRLATQLAATLQQVLQVERLEITDGGKPVPIPGVGAVFPVDSVSGRYQPEQPSRQLFYVHKGAVYQETGRRIPGRVGLGVYGLTSVALTTNPGSDALEVAGVRGEADCPGRAGRRGAWRCGSATTVI
jgi:hypothetical protein